MYCGRGSVRLPVAMFAVYMLVVAGGCLGIEAAEPPILALSVVPTDRAPNIDGRLTEAAWADTVAAWNFQKLGVSAAASQPTLVRCMYDNAALYIAYECYEAHTDELVATHSDRDSQLWFDDSVELFLDPTHSHEQYYHLVINCDGVRFDERMKDKGWTGDWRAAASVGEQRWTLELAIPFSVIDAQPAEMGTLFAVNFCRNRKAAGSGHGKHGEWSCWARVESSYHEPRHFGHLIFTGPDAGGVSDALHRLAFNPQCSRGSPGALPVLATTQRGTLEYLSYKAQALSALAGGDAGLTNTLQRIEKMLSRSTELDEKMRAGFQQRAEALQTRVKHLKERVAKKHVGQLVLHSVQRDVKDIASEAETLEWDLKFELLFAGLE